MLQHHGLPSKLIDAYDMENLPGHGYKSVLQGTTWEASSSAHMEPPKDPSLVQVLVLFIVPSPQAPKQLPSTQVLQAALIAWSPNVWNNDWGGQCWTTDIFDSSN